jgi:hypothetical protein
MKLGNWKDSLEAIGLIAIVASLIFVGFQVRQDQVIARSELTSESFELMIALHQNLLDPGFAGTYAKMLDRSEDLSLEEMVQLDSLLAAVRTLYIRECYLHARGIFVECEAVVRDTVEKYFGNWYGQAWWRLNKPQDVEVLGSLPNWLDSKIESLDSNDYRRMLEEAATRN